MISNPRGGDHCPPSDNTARPATAVRPKAPPRSSHPETAPACSSAQTSHNSTARPMSVENAPSASSFYFIQTKRGSQTCADISLDQQEEYNAYFKSGYAAFLDGGSREVVKKI